MRAKLSAEFLTNVLANIMSAKVTDVITLVYRRTGGRATLRNHELDSAVQRSFLSAQLSVCNQCINDSEIAGHLTSAEIGWLNRRMVELTSDLARISSAPQRSMILDDAIDVTHVGSTALGYHESIQAQLVVAATGGEHAPSVYRHLLEAELYQRMLAYFSLEVKHNSRVNSSLESELHRLLLQNQSLLTDGHGEPSAPIPSFLRAICVSPTGAGNTSVGLPSRNPWFVGRKPLLAAVRGRLSDSRRKAVVSLIGLGGVGKSQLALEYAYRHRTEYSKILWVRADEPATLALDYSNLVDKLPIAYGPSHDMLRNKRAVRSWLENTTGWLLVFDGATDPATLDSYLPADVKGHVIITSRNGGWQSVAETIQVPVFTPQEALEFFQHRTQVSSSAVLGQLAEALGAHPLALEQAGSYIMASGLTPEEYLKLYYRARATLEGAGESHGHWSALLTTTKLAYDRLDEDGKRLASLCAFLGEDYIPLSLLRLGIDVLPAQLFSFSQDSEQWERAVKTIVGSAVGNVSSGFLSFRPMVQLCIRHLLPDRDRTLWARLAVKLMDRAVVQNDSDACLREILVPHAVRAAGHAESLGISSGEAGRLLGVIGSALAVHRDYSTAKMLLARSQAILERTYGFSNPNVALTMSSLAAVLVELGDISGARANMERALAAVERTGRSRDPALARVLEGLSHVLIQSEDLFEARQVLERVISIDESNSGFDSPRVADDLVKLAGVLLGLTDYRSSRSCLDRALRIYQSAYGSHHGKVANALGLLGRAYVASGDTENALMCSWRALGVYHKIPETEHTLEDDLLAPTRNLWLVVADLIDLGFADPIARHKLLGDSHSSRLEHYPSLLLDYANQCLELAQEAEKDRLLESAEESYLRALKVFQRLEAGLDAPTQIADVRLATMLRVALVSEEKQELDQAMRWYSRALETMAKSPRADSTIALLRANASLSLGRISQQKRRFSEAEKWYRRSLSMLEGARDAGSIPTVMYNLGLVTQELGQFEQAEDWYKRSLRLAELVRDQLGISQCLYQLGRVSQDLQKYRAAERFYRRSLSVAESISDQEGISLAQYQLGIIAQQQGDRKGAKRLYLKVLEAAEKHGDQLMSAKAFHQLGLLSLDVGRLQEATEHFQRSLSIAEALGDRAGEAAALVQLSAIALSQNKREQSETLLRRAHALYVQIDDKAGLDLVRHGFQALLPNGGPAK